MKMKIDKNGYLKYEIERSKYACILMGFIKSKWPKNSMSFFFYKLLKGWRK